MTDVVVCVCVCVHVAVQFGHEDWVFDLKWLDDRVVVSGEYARHLTTFFMTSLDPITQLHYVLIAVAVHVCISTRYHVSCKRLQYICCECLPRTCLCLSGLTAPLVIG